MIPFKKNKETPAEQLLRMIEGPQPTTGGPKPPPTPSVHRVGIDVHELALSLWRRIVPGQREVDAFLWNLRIAQRALWLVLAGLGAYVVFDLVIASKPKINPRILMTGIGTAPPLKPVEPDHSLAPLSDYLVSVKQRNPFTGESATEERAVIKTTKHRLEELASGLVVVGIDRGPNPVALIENTTQKRTFMVKVGDDINGMIVKKIGPEGVVISYEGEEFVLP